MIMEGDKREDTAVLVNNLHFSYGDREVLSGINLRLPRGSR
jgi:ABC-type histidine transport system ATPase subunit